MKDPYADLKVQAQLDFERHFGPGECLVYVDYLGSEETIVVENYVKRAFYSLTVELIKVLNLQGEE